MIDYPTADSLQRHYYPALWWRKLISFPCTTQHPVSSAGCLDLNNYSIIDVPQHGIVAGQKSICCRTADRALFPVYFLHLLETSGSIVTNMNNSYRS